MPTLVTWNVNSIRARLARVTAWLERSRPDIVCLQETKVEDERFPPELARLGYHVTLAGQRTYNGVAILSRRPPADVARGFGDADPQQRLLAATIDGMRIVSVYAPNGGTLTSDKFTYKMDWYARLQRYLAALAPAQPLALCGDFNVAPEARDVDRPDEWATSVLFHPDARAALARIAAWGLTDSFRIHTQAAGHYSWWDYRAGSWRRNDGLRIDHVLVTGPLAARVDAAIIDRNERAPRDGAGKQDNPSDHAPVVVTLG